MIRTNGSKIRLAGVHTPASRLHRVGQEQKEVLTMWIDEASSIDENVLEALQRKAEIAIRDHVKWNMRAEIEQAIQRTKGPQSPRAERGPEGDRGPERDI